jgi:ribosomal protein L34E
MTILESTPKITGSMLNGIFRGRFIAEIRAPQSENRPKNPKNGPLWGATGAPCAEYLVDENMRARDFCF